MKDRSMTAAAELQRSLDARFRRPLMSFFLRRASSHSEAEDLTQQVFLRILASGQEQIDNPEAFVFTVAANLLRDRARKSGRIGHSGDVLDPNLISEIVTGLVEDRTAERVLLGRESLADVWRALDELGERTRDIFILFRLENMKQSTIAELYGIGVSTVEKSVMKATLHLALRFDRKPK